MLQLQKLELHFDLPLFFIQLLKQLISKRRQQFWLLNSGLVAEHPEKKLRGRCSKNKNELAVGWSKANEAGTGQM